MAMVEVMGVTEESLRGDALKEDRRMTITV